MKNKKRIEELRKEIEDKKNVIDNSQVYGGDIDFEGECNNLQIIEERLETTKTANNNAVDDFGDKLTKRTMGTTKLNPIDKSRVCAEIDKIKKEMKLE